MAWARIATGTIWKLAAIETGPGTSHAAILKRLEISARSDMPNQGSPEVLCRTHGKTKHWMPPRRARQHQEMVERGRRFWSVYIGKPGSKNAKEIRVDAASGQILAV
jgi:hypothetical protein